MHKILIEKLMRNEYNTEPVKINVYCFNGIPKIIIKFCGNKMSIWDENFNSIDNIFNFLEENVKSNADKFIYKAYNLSKILSKDFIFVRVDWMLFEGRLYFEELTFTPYSGFNVFKNKKINMDLGNLLEVTFNDI